MIPILLFLLLAGSSPLKDEAPTMSGAATSPRHHRPAGTRKPSKPPKKKEPDSPRDRPVNKNRCLDSAAAGGVVWTTFCRDVKDASIRKRCFELGLESEQRRQGFCHNFF
jgi:hypothetical protein